MNLMSSVFDEDPTLDLVLVKIIAFFDVALWQREFQIFKVFLKYIFLPKLVANLRLLLNYNRYNLFSDKLYVPKSQIIIIEELVPTLIPVHNDCRHLAYIIGINSNKIVRVPPREDVIWY